MLAGLYLAFFISAVVNLFIIIYSKKKALLNNESRTNYDIHIGPQKVHKTPTPRIGGLGIFLGFLAFITYAYTLYRKFTQNILPIIFVGSIPLIVGIVEDISARIKPGIRFIALSITSALAFIFLNAQIIRLDIPFDFLLNYKLFSFLFTVFALTGITNSINIIDGFNGLASLSSVVTFSSFAYVSNRIGDDFLFLLSLAMIASTLGFIIFNYPCGLIFLGDGGAYFLGFMIGITAIYLFNNHSNVSPWYPLMVNIYPVFEVLYSIYRRKIIKQKHAFNPDCMHFHSLVYKRMNKWLPIKKSEYLKRNSMTTIIVLLFSALGVLPANIFWNNSLILASFFILFGLIYIYIYWYILIPRSVKKEICISK